jgi:hypothetical protein
MVVVGKAKVSGVAVPLEPFDVPRPSVDLALPLRPHLEIFSDAS